MKFFVLKILMFFDYFHKRKILMALNNLLVNKNIIIFDVGAHYGESILLFKKKFKIAKVYTFEPLEKSFLRLKKNTKKMHDKIEYFNFALGDKKEKRTIKEMIESSSSTLNEINEKSLYFKKKKFYLGINKKKKMFKEKNVDVEKGIDIVNKFDVNNIDILKIDTEGYEYNVIKGFESSIKKVGLIIFEHHYDLMIKKNYTYRDINRYLISKGFEVKYKFKMPFRKTFEYIYYK